MAFLITGGYHMRIGDERLFKYHINGNVKQELGRVIGVGGITSDGVKFIEVVFHDKVRKYSLDHI